jgi:predicted enzyme related to lactoylglutathione lyase
MAADARHLCTVVLARNYPKLVAWYRKALAMKVKRVVTEGFDWTELAREGLRIGITPAKQMGVKLPAKRSNAVVLHLVSRDVRGLMKQVKRAGARILFGPSHDEKDGYWYGAFADLEGNPIWVIDLEA